MGTQLSGFPSRNVEESGGGWPGGADGLGTTVQGMVEGAQMLVRGREDSGGQSMAHWHVEVGPSRGEEGSLGGDRRKEQGWLAAGWLRVLPKVGSGCSRLKSQKEARLVERKGCFISEQGLRVRRIPQGLIPTHRPQLTTRGRELL